MGSPWEVERPLPQILGGALPGPGLGGMWGCAAGSWRTRGWGSPDFDKTVLRGCQAESSGSGSHGVGPGWEGPQGFIPAEDVLVSNDLGPAPSLSLY